MLEKEINTVIRHGPVCALRYFTLKKIASFRATSARALIINYKIHANILTSSSYNVQESITFSDLPTGYLPSYTYKIANKVSSRKPTKHSEAFGDVRQFKQMPF